MGSDKKSSKAERKRKLEHDDCEGNGESREHVKDKKVKRDKGEKGDKKSEKSHKRHKDKSEREKNKKHDKKAAKSSKDNSNSTVNPALANSQNTDGTTEAANSNVVKTSKGTSTTQIIRYLVPFAEPLANAEELTMILRLVRKASRVRSLVNGIRESQKLLRRKVDDDADQTSGKKSGTSSNSQKPCVNPSRGIVVLAGDTFPWDIISHMPLLSEEAGFPYIYIPSREALGRAAGSSRLQTSALIILPDSVKSLSKQTVTEQDTRAFKEEFDKVYEACLTAQQRIHAI